MKSLACFLLAFLTVAGFTFAQDATTLASTGQIAAIGTNTPHTITANVKTAGGTTSMVFVVTDNTKFATAGLGVFGELKKGDNVKIEYVEKNGGARDAVQVSVEAPATTTPAKQQPPAKKTPSKKAPAKKKK